LSLRELYRTVDEPGKHPLKDAQEALDQAVRRAYGAAKKTAPLTFLLDLNLEVAESEAAGKPVVGPGLPDTVKHPETYVTDDCVTMPPL
jgi:hypothetical protein